MFKSIRARAARLWLMVAATLAALAASFLAGYRRSSATGRPALFPGRGEMGGGGDLVIGIILLAVAVVISVTLISPQITALVAAEAITGIDTSAAALLPVGQLVVVVVFGIGVAVGGLAFIFKAAAKLM